MYRAGGREHNSTIPRVTPYSPPSNERVQQHKEHTAVSTREYRPRTAASTSKCIQYSNANASCAPYAQKSSAVSREPCVPPPNERIQQYNSPPSHERIQQHKEHTAVSRGASKPNRGLQLYSGQAGNAKVSCTQYQRKGVKTHIVALYCTHGKRGNTQVYCTPYQRESAASPSKPDRGLVQWSVRAGKCKCMLYSVRAGVCNSIEVALRSTVQRENTAVQREKQS